MCIHFRLSALIKYNGMSVKEAADYLMNKELKDIEEDIGLIALDTQGNLAMEFNSDRMHRAWRTSDGQTGVGIYRDWEK